MATLLEDANHSLSFAAVQAIELVADRADTDDDWLCDSVNLIDESSEGTKTSHILSYGPIQ